MEWKCLPTSETLSDPGLKSFDVDMNAGLLVLHFDETINITSLKETYFTLQDNATTIRVNQTLTTSLSYDDDTSDATIVLSPEDFNEIKRKEFCVDNNTCYLTFEDDAVLDMVDRPIEGIPNGYGLQVDVFTKDTRSPTLTEFTSINLENGEVVLTMDETVDISSLRYATITLQSLLKSSHESSLI